MKLSVDGWRATSEFPTVFTFNDRQYAVGLMVSDDGQVGVALATTTTTRIIARAGVEAVNAFDYHLRGAIDECITPDERGHAIAKLIMAGIEGEHDEAWLCEFTAALIAERLKASRETLR